MNTDHQTLLPTAIAQARAGDFALLDAIEALALAADDEDFQALIHAPGCKAVALRRIETGARSKTCQDCDGEGALEVRTQSGRYVRSIDCDSCDGEGIRTVRQYAAQAHHLDGTPYPGDPQALLSGPHTRQLPIPTLDHALPQHALMITPARARDVIRQHYKAARGAH